ncbi:hypothetical protein O181_010991 [Austropuccinia psidii MF-1]|uniref:Dystroglycan-type cadherin-like domain-containing protein n=1 Tax=Austropuccinia psidii MF-1 TaxID=1389203 RepID=A0A9Q3BUY1_9BASI|nr:hypothetical protein [Austropuccinia psidii MF-1]
MFGFYFFLFLLSLFQSSQSSSNAPFLAYPLSDQRPPVARVGQPFSWSFLPGTFNTSHGTTKISLSAKNLPIWATFDPSTRTISGTPDSSHLGTTLVNITAYDVAKSSSISDSLRILVATTPPPRVNLPLRSQFQNGSVLGSVSFDHATGGIIVPPNCSWSIGLPLDTFVTSSNKGVYYTAYELGTTSLPSWMKFNTVTATFEGVSPSQEEHIWLAVYGSDYVGYGDVEEIFQFTITQPVLDLVVPLPDINATLNSLVNYTIPFDGFTIGGIGKNSSTVLQVDIDLARTPFLTYNENNFSIIGALPASLPELTNVTIPVSFSTLGDHNKVSTQINLRIFPGLFTAPILPPVYIHATEEFTVDLSQYTLNVNATYSLGSLSAKETQRWLQLSSNPFSIVGKAPSLNGSSSQSITVDLDGFAFDGTKSSVKLPLVLIQSMTGERGNFAHGWSTRMKISLVILVGCIIGVALLVFIMFLCSAPYYSEEVHQSGNPEALGQFSGEATLVEVCSPSWETKKGFGGPMRARTLTELANGVEIGLSYSGSKRLEFFKVFANPAHLKSPRLPTTRSPQELGIIPFGGRLDNLVPASNCDCDRTEFEGRARRDDHSQYPVSHNGATFSEDRHISLNTSRSSSLFHSDTQSFESEGSFSSSSGTDSEWQGNSRASTPKRREDYSVRQITEILALIGCVPASKRTSDANPKSAFGIYRSPSEERPADGSESIGVIQTGSHHKKQRSSSIGSEQKTKEESPLAGPIFVTVSVGNPFRMTPIIEPQVVHTANDSSTPGITCLHSSHYFALSDYPDEPTIDRQQLPGWLHFDPKAQEISGTPRKTDVGLIPMQIIERRPTAILSTFQPPTVQPSNEEVANEVETVVARLVLDVVDRSSS